MNTTLSPKSHTLKMWKFMSKEKETDHPKQKKLY